MPIILRLLIGSSALLYMHGSAIAQATDTPDVLVVTGTKIDIPLQEVISSVDVFDETAIEQENSFVFDDLIYRSVNISGTGETGSVSIRGIGRLGVSGTGNGVTSNVYIDGAPFSTTGLSGSESLWDVDQVEIFRGPQSTIQGRNALAGAIIINTNDPTYHYEASGQVRVGNHGDRQYAGVWSGPIVEDQLAVRLVADYQDFEGDTINVISGENANFAESLTLRGKVLYEPSAIPDLRAELTVDYADSDQSFLGSLDSGIAFGTPEFEMFDPFGGVIFGAADINIVDALRYVGQIDYRLNRRWSLTSILTFEDSEQRNFVGGTTAPELFELTGVGVEDSGVFSAELRANFVYGQLKGWIGAYYYDEDRTNVGRFDFPLSLFGVTPNPLDTAATSFINKGTETENYAVFGDVIYNYNEHWTFGAGLRYDRETFFSTGEGFSGKVQPADCVIPDLGGLPCGALFPVNEAVPIDVPSFDAFLPKVSLSYNFDADRSLSFSVSRGYRAGGGFIPFSNDPSAPASLQTFDPEYLWNYELAFRSTWLDKRLRLNANVFFADWTDQQISLPGPSGLLFDTVISNAGSSEVFGGEFELNWIAPLQGLSISASLGLLSAEFTDFPFALGPDGTEDGNPATPFENLAGNDFPNSPNVSASLSAYYDHSSGAFFDFGVNFTDDRQFNIENVNFAESDTLIQVNARLGYRNDRFEIYSYVDNALDERAILTTFPAFTDTQTGEVSPSSSQFRFNPNRPRSYGVVLKVNY